MQHPLLHQRFPDLQEAIPWLPLGNFPTALKRLHNLEQLLDLHTLWIKRDDLSGDLYGGNKVRTLEYVLAQAIQRGAKVVASYSALGSSWPLACTVYAGKLGLESDVYYMPYPMDEIKHRNLQRTRGLARHVYCARSSLTFPFLMLRKLLQSRRRDSVYLTPPGGTSATTLLAFVNAAIELGQQVADGEMPRPDVIYCPFGSGGTAAGLALGLCLLGWPTQVVAVRVVDRIVANSWNLRRLTAGARRILQAHGATFSQNVNCRIEHDYFGKGYSRPLPQAQQAISLAKEHEPEVVLDSAYTGKTFAALIRHGRESQLSAKHVLFWQTLNSRSLTTGK